VVYIPEQEEEEVSASGGSGGGSGAIQFGSAPETPASPGGGGVPAETTPKQQTFASFQDYIQPNLEQVATNAQKLADKEISSINDQKNIITGAESNFKDQTTSGGAKYAGYNDEFITNALANPTTATPADRETFQNYLNASYSGPGSITDTPDFGKATGAFQKAKERIELYKTPEGLKQAVIGGYNKPTSSRGALDTALFEAVPESREKFKEILPYEQQLGDLMSGYQDNAQSWVQDQKDLAATARTNTAAKSDEAISGFKTSLADTTATKRASLALTPGKEAEMVAKIKSSRGQLSPEELNTLGVTKTQAVELAMYLQLQDIMATLGVSGAYEKNKRPTIGERVGAPTELDLQRFLQSENADAIEGQRFLSKEDFTKSKAFNDLLGSGRVDVFDESVYGTAPTDITQFGMDDALSRAKDNARSYAEQTAPHTISQGSTTQVMLGALNTYLGGSGTSYDPATGTGYVTKDGLRYTVDKAGNISGVAETTGTPLPPPPTPPTTPPDGTVDPTDGTLPPPEETVDPYDMNPYDFWRKYGYIQPKRPAAPTFIQSGRII